MINGETYSGPPPRRWTEARYCEGELPSGGVCGTKVHSYTQRQMHDTQGLVGPLLCSRCVDNFEPTIFRAGVARTKSERVRKARNSLNSSGRPVQGDFLPGLRPARLNAGKTQKWLATALDRDEKWLSKIDRQARRATPETAEKLAKALGVPVSELYKDPESETYQAGEAA